LNVAGVSALGGGGATIALLVLSVIDHFGLCGCAGGAMITDRVDTVLGAVAAGSARLADPEGTADCFLGPVAPALDEPVDAPPRAEGESPSEEDDEDRVPGSACATRGAATDVPSAAVNSPAASREWN
jgi:hypothetical protein